MTTDIITPEEHALLRFPGDVPGLLRLCSPTTRGIVVHAGPDCVWCVPAGVPPDGPRFEAKCRAMLDLTDATGRAHLAWWIGGVGASLHMACDGHRRWELHGGERPRESVSRAWEGIGAESRRLRGSPPMYGWDTDDVSVLDALDPNDPRLLPDGSRLVDALALSLVGRHLLAGGG